MFTNKDLRRLIIPLIIEQALALFVGMVDVIMVSSVGEAAVSGVSLVDIIGVLFINMFTALATGGAVVVSQYLGHKDRKKACQAADQLILSAVFVAACIMIFCLIGNPFLLHTIFGNAEKDVLQSAKIYFYITALSYPFLGLYNSCAALFRSMGNSKISMYTSTYMNIANIIGNAILIYVCHMKVEGVAISTLFSRMTASIIIFWLVSDQKLEVHAKRRFCVKPDFVMIKKILRIGIPSGLENSMFQFGKVLVQRLVTACGTAAITANAVANTLAGLEVIAPSAIGIGLITVVGQCIGAGKAQEAKKYVNKLILVAHLLAFVINLSILGMSDMILSFYHLSDATKEITKELLLYHSIVCILIWPESFSLPNVFRAAGDAKFPMIVSIISMWVCRIGISVILVKKFDMGVLGVWIAMMSDWAVRALIFSIRYLKGKWVERKALIE